MLSRRLLLRRSIQQHVAAKRLASSISTTLGIRAEDPQRLWERRCPLTPDAVAGLTAQGVDVVVQPCNKRVFADKEFVQAGARIDASLDSASIIIGIKEVPLDQLITSPLHGRPRSQIFFSHTAKGQPYNLPLLARFLGDSSRPRLIDYEQLVGSDGKRTVGFGFFAGSAGVIEGLNACALDLLEIGIASPFLHLPRPYAHRDLASVKASLRTVGNHIGQSGTPQAAGPFVIAVTGGGNVTKGALDMLKELPIQYVQPDQLPALVANPHTDLRKVYVVLASPASYFIRDDGLPYEREDYYARPSSYQSRFYETIAPYVSLLINGAGWQPGFPRLMSNQDLAHALRNARAVGRARFRSIADITCDIEGGLEFVSRSTTIDSPFYTARPTSLPPDLPGVQVMGVDILPTEIPLDASQHFSSKLVPYLEALIKQDSGVNAAALNDSERELLAGLDRATIAREGKLMEQHRWLYERVANIGSPASSSKPLSDISSSDLFAPSSSMSSSSASLSSTLPFSPTQPLSASQQQTRPLNKVKKKVLLFGSGMVAKPFCQTVWKRSGDVQLIVASNNTNEAKSLVRGFEDASEVVGVDIEDAVKVEALVESADIVASLLPAPLHPKLAELCLKHRKHLVTASYISPTMESYSDRAIEADVLFLNEIGLDPGIDHLAAMEMRDRFEREGKKIVSFVSWCGGLPAPEASNVPLGMKFSWSPKALLTAATNPAQFKLKSHEFDVEGTDLLSSYFPDVPLLKGFALEGLANRNSLPYAEKYNLGSLEDVETVFRGTLRYKGFARLLGAFSKLGFLSSEEGDAVEISRWDELGAKVLGRRMGHGRLGPISMVTTMPETADFDNAMDALEELSIFPNSGKMPVETSLPPVPVGPRTPMDHLATILAHKLRYNPGERDMVILSHEVITEPNSSSLSSQQREVHTSTLVAYGDSDLNGNSAMARTVGIPLASATLRILDGHVRSRGVRAPIDSEVYLPVLEQLKEEGVALNESRSSRSMVDEMAAATKTW